MTWESQFRWGSFSTFTFNVNVIWPRAFSHVSDLRLSSNVLGAFRCTCSANMRTCSLRSTMLVLLVSEDDVPLLCQVPPSFPSHPLLVLAHTLQRRDFLSPLRSTVGSSACEAAQVSALLGGEGAGLDPLMDVVMR